jgi:predicted RecA/RadA family phage recombinase
MKNFVQPGEIITVDAPANVSSGDFVVVGKLAGVAATDAASGDDLEIATRGVFELPITGLSQGDPVYWDVTPGALTGTATDNFRVGVAVAASGAATTRVRLDGLMA